jgi:hypothetical protein
MPAAEAAILEKLDKVLERQNAIAAGMTTLADVLEGVRDQIGELLEWAQQPPSSELSDLIAGMTNALEALAGEVKAMPDAVAEAIAARVRR